jgi:hypothetical protein
MGDGPGKVRALQTKMQGMVEVKVSCHPRDAQRVRLSVIDTADRVGSSKRLR